MCGALGHRGMSFSFFSFLRSALFSWAQTLSLHSPMVLSKEMNADLHLWLRLYGYLKQVRLVRGKEKAPLCRDV